MTDSGHSPPRESGEETIKQILAAMRAENPERERIGTIISRMNREMDRAQVAALVLVHDDNDTAKTTGGNAQSAENPLTWCHRHKGERTSVEITLPDLWDSEATTFRRLRGTLVQKRQSKMASPSETPDSGELQTLRRIRPLEMPFRLNADSGSPSSEEDIASNDVCDSFQDAPEDDLDENEFGEVEFELSLEPIVAVYDEDYQLAAADVVTVPSSWTSPDSLPTISSQTEILGREERDARERGALPGREAGHRPSRLNVDAAAKSSRMQPEQWVQGKAKGQGSLLSGHSSSGKLSAELSPKWQTVGINADLLQKDTLVVSELSMETSGTSTERHWTFDFTDGAQTSPTREADGRIYCSQKWGMAPVRDHVSLKFTVRPFQVSDVWMLPEHQRARFLGSPPLSSLTVRRTSDTTWTLSIFEHDLDELETALNAAVIFRLLPYEGGVQ